MNNNNNTEHHKQEEYLFLSKEGLIPDPSMDKFVFVSDPPPRPPRDAAKKILESILVWEDEDDKEYQEAFVEHLLVNHYGYER